jgi:predicted metalloprotease with PDZ domain
MNIHYKLSFPQPHTHYIQVEITLKEVNAESILLSMPVWTPGSYMIRDYTQHVDLFRATDYSGHALPFQKVEKNKWVVETQTIHELKISYRVYGFDDTVRTNFMDADKASLCSAATFLFVEGEENTPSTLEIEPFKSWKNIATPLKMVSDNIWVRKAENKDHLIDSPIEIGNFNTYHFEAAGIPHSIAIIGECNGNHEQIVRDLQQICNATAGIINAPHPCSEYLFIIQNTENRYNGLEHLHSTVCQLPRWDYYPEDKYIRSMGLLSHEYFHLWNVKRIRPIELGPFNYDKENYTRQLWVMEGITSYYDDYILYKSGLISEDKLLNILSKNFNVVVNQAGDDEQSLTDSSFDAWIKYYRKNENSNNNTVSYYTKGATVALALNFLIMNASKGKFSLDDVMQELYQNYLTHPTTGFTENEFLTLVNRLAGIDLSSFFQDHIYGTVPINYDQYFEYVGLTLVDINQGKDNLYLGLTSKWEEGRLMIKSIDKNYGAYQSGLNVNDEIIAVDGYRVWTEFERILEQKKVGETVEVIISREGKIKKMQLHLTPDKRAEFRIFPLLDVTELQQKLQKKWLSN